MKTKTVQQTYNEISKLTSGQYCFIDIRDEESFHFLHPLNAENYPSKLKALARFFEEKDKNKPIYIICYRGNSSLLLQGLLESKGFTNTYSVEGGFAAWADNHLPVQVKGEQNSGIGNMNLYSLTQEGEEKNISAHSQLETMGLMMAGAFHEIMNPLTIIDAGLKNSVRDIYEAREIAKDGEFSGLLDKMDNRLLKLSEAVSRIESITKVMKDMSYKSSSKEKELMDVSSFVEEVKTIALMITSFPIEINICSEIYSKNIYFHKNQVIQVLVNLIKNSSDAIENLSVKWISVCISEENEMLIIKVTDSGGGIPEELLSKIANPLFTTKEKGKGTGLGISIVKQITKANDGDLYLDQASENTSFVATLRATK